MKRNIRTIFGSALITLLVLQSVLISPIKANGGGEWQNYTFDKDVSALALKGNILWAGTWGGVLRWDLTSDTYTKYTLADGLADNYIHDLAIDDLNRVWAATDSGLSMFNGTTWTTYDNSNSPIPGDSVHLVAVSSDNRVWLHSRSINGSWGEGLTVFNGSTWTTYTEANSGIPDDDVRAIAIDHNNHVWIGTPFGDAGEYDGASWTTYPNINYGAYNIYAIAVDSTNKKWYISYLPDYRRILTYDGAIWTAVDASLTECNVVIKDLAFGAGDVAWFSTLNNGLCRFDGSTWTRYHTGNSGITANALLPVAAAGSNVWVGYDVLGEGIDQFNGSSWKHIDTPNGLPDRIGTWGLAVDQETWFGGYDGVHVYDGINWQNYNSLNSGLAATGYDDIAEGTDGHLWFAGGNNGGGLVEYDRQTTWTQHYGIGGISDSFVYAIAVGGDGRVWAGSRAGLHVYNGISWYTYTEANSDLPNNKVEQIAIDGDGDIWVGPGCTTRFDGTTWTTYANQEDAIQNNFDAIVNTIDEDPTCWVSEPDMGKVWLSKLNLGVKYYNGSSWVSYSNANMGFSPGTWYARLGGRDRSGDLWVKFLDSGAYHGGVSQFDGATWVASKRSDGVIDPPGDVSFTHNGQVWVSGSRGFSVYSNPWKPVVNTIYPATGGTLNSIDGSTKVVFPPGAVSVETTLTYTAEQPMPTGDLEHIGHFFEMSAVISGTTTPVTSFSQPFTVTVEYTDAEVGVISEPTLSLYSWNGSAWVGESSTLDTTANLVTSTLDHLTHFAVLGETNRIYLPLVR